VRIADDRYPAFEGPDRGQSSRTVAMYLPLNAVLPPPRRRDAIVHMPPRASSTRKDGSHDFDFELGTWAVRGSRLLEPLSGSTEWLDFSRVSRATRIFNRGAVLVELESDTP